MQSSEKAECKSFQIKYRAQLKVWLQAASGGRGYIFDGHGAMPQRRNMDGQLSIFEFLDTPQKRPPKNKILSVGSMIGRVVLGECRVEIPFVEYDFYSDKEMGHIYTATLHVATGDRRAT